MTEFTNLIRVTRINDAQGRTFEFLADPYDFQPQPSDDEGGKLWDCDHDFVIDMPDADALAAFSMPRLSVVTLKGSDGRMFPIGTSDVPARVVISRHLGRARLVMQCKMLSDPLA